MANWPSCGSDKAPCFSWGIGYKEYFEEGQYVVLVKGEELQALKRSGTLSLTPFTPSIRLFTELGYYLEIAIRAIERYIERINS